MSRHRATVTAPSRRETVAVAVTQLLSVFTGRRVYGFVFGFFTAAATGTDLIGNTFAATTFGFAALIAAIVCLTWEQTTTHTTGGPR